VASLPAGEVCEDDPMGRPNGMRCSLGPPPVSVLAVLGIGLRELCDSLAQALAGLSGDQRLAQPFDLLRGVRTDSLRERHPEGVLGGKQSFLLLLCRSALRGPDLPVKPAAFGLELLDVGRLDHRISLVFRAAAATAVLIEKSSSELSARTTKRFRVGPWCAGPTAKW